MIFLISQAPQLVALWLPLLFVAVLMPIQSAPPMKPRSRLVCHTTTSVPSIGTLSAMADVVSQSVRARGGLADVERTRGSTTWLVPEPVPWPLNVNPAHSWLTTLMAPPVLRPGAFVGRELMAVPLAMVLVSPKLS